MKTRINTDRQLNQRLFNNILNEFEEKLEKEFSKMLTQASVVELKQDLAASWLADCSMAFSSVYLMVNQFPLQGDIIFDAKPDAVPYNYRISYKVSQLCLIMYICGWGTSCSLIKLHMISFALLSRKNMDNLLEFSDKTNESVVVRFDPAVNRALTYAVAYGFVVQQQNGNYKLTDQGKNFAERIKLAGDLMVTEIRELTDLSKRLTESRIKELTEIWRDRHAED